MRRLPVLTLFLFSFLFLSAQPGEWIERSFMKDDSLRRYAVYIPSSYTGETPFPAVYNLPGNANFIEFFRVFIRMQETAEAEGFLYVVPEATVVENPPFGVAPSWNVTGDPSRPDDFDFLREVMLRVASEFAVDTRRVYSSGHSQGAIMNFLMLCQLPEYLAAVGPVSGRPPALTLDFCPNASTPARPIALIYGTGDPILPFTEVTIPGPVTFPAVPDYLDVWRINNGCGENATETDLPDIDPEDGSTVTLLQYPDCEEGKDVWFFRVNDGGHYWPNATDLADLGLEDIDFGSNNKDIDGGEALWAFFEPFELDAPPFELLNAQRNGRMGPLMEGQVLDQSIMPLKLSVQVNPEMEDVDAMDMQLEGPLAYSSTERNAPYTLFGNRGNRSNGRFLPQGDYTLTATPYVQGVAQEPMVVRFSVAGPTPTLGELVLVNADTDEDIGPLTDGDVLSPEAMYNLRAVPAGDQVRSVIMQLQGPRAHRQRENTAPYALFGNNGDDYEGMMLPPGPYTLTATPYPRRNAFGEPGEPLVVPFVVGEMEVPVRDEAVRDSPMAWKAFPNPARETITVGIPELDPDETLRLWLTDLAGRQVKDLAPLGPGRQQLTLDRGALGLPSGSYILHARSDARALPPLTLIWQD